MNPKLKAAAEAAFDQFRSDTINVTVTTRMIFEYAFEKCLTHLQSQGGEFDDDAAENELDQREAMVSLQMKDDDPDRFIDGARWQHAQSAALVGVLWSDCRALAEALDRISNDASVTYYSDPSYWDIAEQALTKERVEKYIK